MPNLQVKPFKVPLGSPFESDIFGRQKLVKSIYKLALNVEESLVVGLKAPWGHGKSTIIDRLEAHINVEHLEEIGILKYDAYKNDYISDVFISISSAINSFLEGQVEKESSDAVKDALIATKDNFLKSGGKICKSLLKNAAIRGVKYTTAGIVDLPEIASDLEEVLEGTVSDSAGNIVGEAGHIINSLISERLTDANKDQSLLVKFNDDLQAALNASNIKRLIFVIDELDRCRPSFSVEVLEKVKHFFTCKNVLFILVYNKEQLESSISHVYGVNEPNIYLQKFIDLESDVSIQTEDTHNNLTIRQFIEHVVNKHEFNRDWSEAIVDTLKNAFRLFEDESSLRAIERVCTRVASYCLIHSDGDLVYDKHLATSFCMLAICKPEYFKAIFDRAKLVAGHHGEINEVILDLNDVEPILREYLLLIRDCNHNLFNRMYEHIIHYLIIKDGENNGTDFQSGSWSVNRESYIKNCCSLISTFNMG